MSDPWTYLLYLALPLVLTSHLTGAKVTRESIAQCRIVCVSQTLTPERWTDDNWCWDTHNQVLNEPDPVCKSCWKHCEGLGESSELRDICLDSDKCGKGCQIACQFFHSQSKNSAIDWKSRWKFTKTPQGESDSGDQQLEVTWQPPQLPGNVTKQDGGQDLGPVVYVLAARNSNQPKGWEYLPEMVLSSRVRITWSILPYTPEFLLLAVCRRGIVDTIQFKTAEGLVSYAHDDPATTRQLRQLRASRDAAWYIDWSRTYDGVNASLVLTSQVVRSSRGAHTELTTTVSLSGPPWLAAGTAHVYTAMWKMLDCDHAYRQLAAPPNCEPPGTIHAVTLSTEGRELDYPIPELAYSAIYQLVIRLEEDPRVSVEMVLKTPPCGRRDFLQHRCLDEIPMEERDPAPVIADRDDAESDLELTRLNANVTSMLLTSGSDLVEVNITWSPVLTNRTVYNVTTRDVSSWTDVRIWNSTRNPHMVLSLRQNTVYDVKVEAVLQTESTGSTADSGGRGTRQISDRLTVNTSEVELAVVQRPQSLTLHTGDDTTKMNAIIIGVTVVAVLVLLLVLLGAVVKKRNDLKNIIVAKAAVAKSNSYKSSVGGKSDYSNQLIAFTDEWELDPHSLKFSSLLGQGAFGKVLTGYYQDVKVAIKLVREGAPLSYKEDLVAEINLMKQLGSHPNIVCLIGACTMAEPIALVMEFVPLGNLQNFLKKCRLEGDLQKRQDGGPTEITYTVIQENGSLESGVVTPLDMLSFARQVSMAMEYLGDKKYVHRDLAARNILIDYHKVVKVCDFGLSRDIFQDNHYKKLTNGKLPLKWMAIESLRDRIFTTQSDVWSFGILLWEIVTMGASPYPSVALADLYYVLSNGYRMDRPSNCSPELYAMMRGCWEDDPSERPTFCQLRLLLEDLLSEDRDYLVLEDIDVPITASDSSSSPIPEDVVTPPRLPSSLVTPPRLPSPGSPSSLGLTATEGLLLRSFPSQSSTSSAPCLSLPATSPTAKVTSPRRDNLRINVCVHQKSTERLIRPSESDSSPSSC